jgi:hypothetical protein
MMQCTLLKSAWMQQITIVYVSRQSKGIPLRHPVVRTAAIVAIMDPDRRIHAAGQTSTMHGELTGKE